MPTDFIDDFEDGDVIYANHIAQLMAPIHDLESGATFYRVAEIAPGGYSVDFTAASNPNGHFLQQLEAGQMIVFKASHTSVADSNLTVMLEGATEQSVPLYVGGQPIAEGDIALNQMAVVIFNQDYDEEEEEFVNQRFDLVGVSRSTGVLSSPVAIGEGGTGATTAAAARTSLDVPSTTDLTTSLAGKANTSHTHAASDIATGTLGLARGGTNANLSATGGTGQVLKQSTAGGAVSVGALAASEMPSGIDAAKIGGGAVSNTEFGYLDGVTSSIQTQLNGKAASSHNHAAANITSGQLAVARGGTGADLTTTGGVGQVLKQSTAGGALSVGALTASDMPSGIDAGKIGGGAVSNTELSYLDGVTSPIQTQLDGKAEVSHTHAASDITSGNLSVARGGTGAGNATDARTNLGAQAANDYLNQLVALLPTMAPGQLITVDGLGDLVAAEPSTSTGENMNNIGDFKHSFALTAPDGWLECDGSILSQSAYPELFAAIGSNWGPPYASGTESAALSSLNAAPRIKKLGTLWFAYHNGASAYYYSSNGTTWTSASVPGGTYVRDIAYSSSLGLYILASGNGSGALYSSTTGTGSWTSRSTAADFQALEWNGTRFIALHNGGAFTSTNGTAWSSSASVSFVPHQLYYSATLSLWILGAGSYIYSGSSDGTTWTQRHTTYAGGVYWIVEAAGYIWVSTNNGLYRSANGTSWSTFTLALPSGYSVTGGLYPTDFGLACVATNGTLVKLFMSEDGGTTWPAEASATWDPSGAGATTTGGAMDADGNICTGVSSSAICINRWTPTFNFSTEFPLPDIAPDSEGRLCYIKAEE